ncbi:MAG: hypothetical protein LBT06_10750 [Hungatella sp.]|jgi:hypothetical protein|nr:hypothetical protein [Hungatella sp.]
MTIASKVIEHLFNLRSTEADLPIHSFDMRSGIKFNDRSYELWVSFFKDDDHFTYGFNLWDIRFFCDSELEIADTIWKKLKSNMDRDYFSNLSIEPAKVKSITHAQMNIGMISLFCKENDIFFEFDTAVEVWPEHSKVYRFECYRYMDNGTKMGIFRSISESDFYLDKDHEFGKSIIKYLKESFAVKEDHLCET